MATKTYTLNATYESSPAGTDSLKDADDEMRKDRTVMRETVDEEHNVAVTDTPNNQGTHKAGSAIATVDTSEPTTRPDGVTQFATALDKGRLHVDSTSGHILEVLTAASGGTDTWNEIQANSSPGDFIVGGDLTVTTDGAIGGSLTVGTDGAFGGNVTVGGTLDVTGLVNGGYLKTWDNHQTFDTSTTEDEVYDAFSGLVSSGTHVLKHCFGYYGNDPIDYFGYYNSSTLIVVYRGGSTNDLFSNGSASTIPQVLTLYWDD